MKKLRQFDVLVIEEFVKTQFHEPTHGQNYYEVIFIFTGEGLHYLNSNPTDYEANDLFFVSPEDTHYLEIRKETHFGVIKFTDSYFDEKLRSTPNTLLRNRPDLMMLNRAFKELKLGMDELSKVLVRRIMQNLLDSKNRKSLDSSPFVFFQLLSLFGLFQEVWENLTIASPWKPNKDTLISFVHQHIYDPAKIQIKHVARTFNISANYFSVYFKANFGISYRQYVDKYRVKLIESRIKAGFTLRQIADEFGFTDESHLSHYFKRHNTLTFTQYRQSVKEKTDARIQQ